VRLLANGKKFSLLSNALIFSQGVYHPKVCAAASTQLRAAFADPDLQPIKFVDPPVEKVIGPENMPFEVPGS